MSFDRVRVQLVAAGNSVVYPILGVVTAGSYFWFLPESKPAGHPKLVAQLFLQFGFSE